MPARRPPRRAPVAFLALHSLGSAEGERREWEWEWRLGHIENYPKFHRRHARNPQETTEVTGA